jgi:hypothetical protein
VRSKLISILVAVATIVSLSCAALAKWRYCLAPSDRNHKAYVSAAFNLDANAPVVDRMFQRALDRAHVSYDDVQCPRADNQDAILALMRDAVTFNKTLGRAVVYLGWEPVD